MSTRCEIKFEERLDREANEGYRDNVMQVAQIYRHSDGTPKEVIADLKKFKQWNTGRNYDAIYAAANFIFYEKWQFMLRNKKTLPEDELMEWVKLGYGVERPDNVHGDENYLYKVEIYWSKNEYGEITKNAEWEIKVAEIHTEGVHSFNDVEFTTYKIL